MHYKSSYAAEQCVLVVPVQSIITHYVPFSESAAKSIEFQTRLPLNEMVFFVQTEKSISYLFETAVPP